MVINGPCPQPTGLQHAFFCLQQEVARPKATFKPTLCPRRLRWMGGGATRCQHILDQSLHLHSKWWPSLVIFLNWRWSKWIWRCQPSLYFLNYRISRRKHILILQKCTKYAISTFHWICPNVFHPVWSVWPDWADLLDFGKLFKACGNN